MNKVPNGLGVAILMSAILADIAKNADKKRDDKPTDEPTDEQMEKAMREVIEKITGAPCDCQVCTERRELENRSSRPVVGINAGTKGEANSTASADRETATTRSLIEVDGEVAAMVGMTPSMLEDAASAPATMLRITTAQFITTLREAGGSLGEERRAMCAAAETQALNSMELALMALGK